MSWNSAESLLEGEKAPPSSELLAPSAVPAGAITHTGGSCSLESIKVREAKYLRVRSPRLPLQEHLSSKWQVYTDQDGGTGIVCGKKGFRHVWTSMCPHLD